MAKRIKVLKCPQCGSVDVEELRTDFYKCKNCTAEFFIDSDDINVNHYVYDKTKPVPTSTNPKNVGVGLLIISVFFALMFALGFFRKNSLSSFSPEVGWSNAKVYFMETQDDQSVYIVVGKRTDHILKDNNSPVFIGFYDVKTKKQIKLEELPIKVDRLSVGFANMEGDKLYFVLNDKTLFEIDRQAKTAIEFSSAVYKDLKGLESGIAKVELPNRVYENYIKFTNNEGQQVYYMPLLKKTYIGYKEFDDAKKSLDSVRDSVRLETRFMFVESNNSNASVRKCLLIKYKQQVAPGYPVGNIYMDWIDQREYDSWKSSKRIIADTLNGEYLGIRLSYVIESHVQAMQNFTPGRMYFGGLVGGVDVLDCTDSLLLIRFKATPSDDEKYTIQTLDAQTGKVLWTFHVTDDSKMYSPMSGKLTRAGCFIDFARESAFFDSNGKLVSEFDR